MADQELKDLVASFAVQSREFDDYDVYLGIAGFSFSIFTPKE